MRLRPRFSLRTLFALTAICAAVVAWRQSSVNWDAERHKALEWLRNSSSLPLGSVWWFPKDDVPWSLRVWGKERSGVKFVHFDLDKLPQEHRHWIDDLLRLFPDAEIWEDERRVSTARAEN